MIEIIEFIIEFIQNIGRFFTGLTFSIFGIILKIIIIIFLIFLCCCLKISSMCEEVEDESQRY